MNKSTCKDVRLLLSLYIDNMLSDEEMTEVREHLKKCDSCQNEYTLLKGIMTKTAELESPELSAGFAASMHKRLLEDIKLTEIDEEKKALYAFYVRKKKRIYPYVAACAAAVVISVLAFGNLPDSDSFISDTKNDAIETAMPVQTKMPKATENTDAVLDMNLPAATNAPTVTLHPTREPEKEKNTVKINEVQTEAAYEQHEKTEEGQQPEMASRSMPMMASIIADETEEDKTVDVETSAEETTDKAIFDVAENGAVSGASAGAAMGGGGSGGAAREAVQSDSASEEKKLVISVEFSFNNESINKAHEVMSDAEKIEEGYVIPLSQLSEYIKLLESAEGYISHNRYRIENDIPLDNQEEKTIDYAIIVIKG